MIWLIAATAFIVQYIIAARLMFRLYPWRLMNANQRYRDRGRPSFMVEGGEYMYFNSARERHVFSLMLALIWPLILAATIVVYNNEPVRQRQARIDKEAAEQDARIDKLEKELGLPGKNADGSDGLTYSEYRAMVSRG